MPKKRHQPDEPEQAPPRKKPRMKAAQDLAHLIPGKKPPPGVDTEIMLDLLFHPPN